MVTPELIRFLFQYNHWANRRLLDCCTTLSNEQFTRNLGSSFGSVCNTLGHIYGAGWVWNERFEGRSPSSVPGLSGYTDLASVRQKLEEMDLHYVDYVSKLTPEDMNRIIRYKSFAGDDFSNPLWQSLHQVSNHATYHRGQVVTMLRQLGVKPVSTDLIGFYREQTAAAKA